jgi:protein involved in polysaccharide export with SLBB domain
VALWLCGSVPLSLGRSVALWLCGSAALSLYCSAALIPDAQPAAPFTNAPAVSNAGLVSSMDALDDKHKLAAGDRLSFRIVEDQEDPKSIFVTDSGDVELPYVGRFPALNKTCKQLANELKTELEKEYYYKATVIVAVDVMSKSRGKVYLVGQLRMPGPQEIPSDETFTLGKAILRAGGFSDFADKKHVKVTRQPIGEGWPATTYMVNLVEVLEKGKTDKDLTLEPGDLIFVPSRLINF